MGNLLKILSAFFILFIPCLAFASNFGSTAKSEKAEINPGETAKFELLFWTSDKETQKIILQAYAPKGWKVEFSRNNFFINAEKGTELVLLGEKYVLATPITVSVKAFTEGSFLVSAKNIPENEGVSFSQERIFNLSIKLKGTEINQETQEFEKQQEDGKKDKALIIWIVFAAIILISAAIYKYA